MFGYLSSYHIYRMWVDYMGWTMDVSAALMVATVKLTTLAYNYRDGKVLQSDPQSLFPFWKEVAITRVPTFLEFTSYMFYFLGLLAGPPFEMKPYLAYIEGKLHEHPQHNPTGKIPDPKIPTLIRLAESISSMALLLFLSSKYPFDPMYDPNSVFTTYSFWEIATHCYFAMLAKRCSYYFIWKLTESAGNLAGFGFSGYDKDGKPLWERLDNVHILKIEFPSNVRNIAIFWNTRTGEWLKNYVYLRQADGPNGKIPSYALYLTNACSAFWHGFYPGYYMAFIFAAWNTDCARQLRSYFRPMVTTRSKDGKEVAIQPIKFVYDIVGTVFSMICFNYGQVCFVGLSLTRAITISNYLYWAGPLGALAVHVMLLLLPKRGGKKKDE